MRAVPLCAHRARRGPACRLWSVCGKRSIGNTTRGGSTRQSRRQIAVICGEEERSCDKWGNWDIWAKWVRLCETCLATHRFLANEPHALAADEERRHEHVHRSAAIEHRGAPQGTFWRSEPFEPARANANGSSGGSVRNGGWANGKAYQLVCTPPTCSREAQPALASDRPTYLRWTPCTAPMEFELLPRNG